MASKKEWNDPCGKTNYKDEDHRDDRYENGNPPNLTCIMQTMVQERGNTIEVSNSGATGQTTDGKDLMNGQIASIKTFDSGSPETKVSDGKGKD